ncbi:hypothetical protein [Paenibacillus thiaminolyticus]|uniref:Uncharacterized protein n=1 Tax=Paenibacillus thiaminolyticus TaxID=49283 RepID=A0A3A3GJB7_PANTH|nr:hypothetical protein [Paenibacillus thiaminolyticus]RJG24822.1 hypothetical protein DQX05_08235 [Paenibacillus thiaminolyticus]
MIIIYSVGNSKVGIGNVSRASSLYKEFLKNDLVSTQDIYFICEASRSILEQFHLNLLPRVTMTKDKDDSFEFIRSYLKHRKKECLLIVDAPDLSYIDRERLALYGISKFISLTDSNIDSFQPHFFIDTDIFPKKYSYDFPIEIISGAKYHIIRDDLLVHKKSELLDKQIIESVFVCFGGADPAFYTEWFYKNIALDSSFNHIHFTIGIGPAFSESRTGLFASISDRVQVIKCPNIVQEIINHDLVVTLGGLTTYEAMYIGTPVCALEWSYMTPYVRKLHEYNFIENLGTPVKAYDSFKNIINNSKSLFKKTDYAWRTLDGLGARRAANSLTSKQELVIYFH